MRRRPLGLLALAVILQRSSPAGATQRFGPLQLSGNLQTQNLVRDPDASTYEYIQNRNTAHVRLDYDWIQGGRAYGRYDVPFVESSHLLVLWRGVYDSIYDTTPGFVQKEDIHGRAYGGRTYFGYATHVGFSTGTGFQPLPRSQLNLDSLGQSGRDALKFDNQLREAYTDVKLAFRRLDVAAALLDASQQSYEDSLKSYGVGLGTLTDLLAARRELSRARFVELDTKVQLLESSAALAFTTGEISDAQVPDR